MSICGNVGWGFNRSVGGAFDIDDQIKFVIDDGSDLGSSNVFFMILMMEKLWVSF